MQQTRKPKTRCKYDADFKSEVVKMLVSGQTVAYISKALGISENLIYRWKNQNQGVKKATCEQNELALENQQLKDRVRQLETEREILKKALSIFSRQT
ncbi:MULTISPECIES: transposase [unclassified Spirosoma]|uniref:transposase n=1 Tax=unclassified Spirosoma TaxID=2621999 RepID=UPI000969B59B|nr:MULTISPECIES: transposase [unclassified Spirosoma]MBN8825839.1 transposase [Spirosoma sp.]OJW70536.1 MAG: transposase [Spirosoma sp. 48-14]